MDLEATWVEIDELPVSERIGFVPRVLDGVAEVVVDSDEIVFSPEFQAELDRRIAEGDAHPERGIPWEVVEAESAAREQE